MITIRTWRERLKYPNQSFYSEREEARDAEIAELRAELDKLSKPNAYNLRLRNQLENEWAALRKLQNAGSVDTTRINFHVEYRTTWYGERGILCYGKDRKELRATNWREAIDAAMAAQRGEK